MTVTSASGQAETADANSSSNFGRLDSPCRASEMMMVSLSVMASCCKSDAPRRTRRRQSAGFLVTGLLWWYTTWRGYRTIRVKKTGAHVTWMIRSYSIALSAVWFRAIQILLAAGIPSIDNTTIYIASVWLSLLASLLISEASILSIFGKSQATKTLLRHVSASSPSGQLP